MSAQDIIKSIEDAQLREVAEFKTGDTVRVHAKVKEGNRERIQVFEGTVIKRQNGGARLTTSIFSMIGECTGHVFSTPTPLACFLTVNVSRLDY